MPPSPVWRSPATFDHVVERRVDGRVVGLIRLFGDSAGRVILPTRQDIADITGLRFETISRIIKGLERSGVLVPVRVEGVRATRSYAVDPAVLNGLPAA